MSDMDLKATLTLDDEAYRESISRLQSETESAASSLASAMTQAADAATAAWGRTADALARSAAALERYNKAGQEGGGGLEDIKRRLKKLEDAVRRGYGG